MSERQFKAHKLHQFRIEARLTTGDVDRLAGLPEGRCFDIEYKGAGTSKEIDRIIALFVPGERRMRSADEVVCS